MLTPGVRVQVPPRAPKSLEVERLRGFSFSKVPDFENLSSSKIDFSVKIVAGFLRKENLSKMVRRTIKNPKENRRKTLHEAQKIFLQNCRIKNLSPRTLKYYEEDLNYFFSRIQVKYVDEIVLEVYEAFLSGELEAGKKISSLNSRIRGLRVFFKFCADREYMEPFTVKLMKEDEEIKEPYTEAELARLLKKPRTL